MIHNEHNDGLRCSSIRCFMMFCGGLRCFSMHRVGGGYIRFIAAGGLAVCKRTRFKISQFFHDPGSEHLIHNTTLPIISHQGTL